MLWGMRWGAGVDRCLLPDIPEQGTAKQAKPGKGRIWPEPRSEQGFLPLASHLAQCTQACASVSPPPAAQGSREETHCWYGGHTQGTSLLSEVDRLLRYASLLTGIVLQIQEQTEGQQRIKRYDWSECQ